MRSKPDTLKLPAAIVSELGGPDIFQKKRGFRTAPTTHDHRRKTERSQRKKKKPGLPPANCTRLVHVAELSSDYSDDYGSGDKQQPSRLAKHSELAEAPKPKSILKNVLKQTSVEDEGRSPSLEPQKLSQTVRDRLAGDDAEIAFLEKKLGLKGKRALPQSFTEDGLDELLAGVDSLVGLNEDDERESIGKKRRRQRSEEQDWLAQKRRTAINAHSQRQEEVNQTGEDADGLDSDISLGRDISADDNDSILSDQDGYAAKLSGSSDAREGERDNDNEEFEGFEADALDDTAPQQRIRENPYVAPRAQGIPGSAKYIPPSLRTVISSDSEVLVRLRRQIQGLVNRLTEANLLSILGDIEQLYRNHARQHVTSTIVELLLTSICEPTSLPDTLIILPAGFIAAIYKVIGTDFGAQIIQRIVELFDTHYLPTSEDNIAVLPRDSTKETSNLIALLADLYNFQVVGSNLIFDYIRLFLTELSEKNAELLLKIIRTSGPQLRQEDPLSLKDIVSMLRPAIARVGEANISVRTKFMIETMNDLKNNKMKTGATASAVVSEHTVRMRKMLGSLNNRSIKGTEPLRIGLKDIQESDKKGKWWLVGASWAGNENESDSAGFRQSYAAGMTKKSPDGRSQNLDPGSADIVQLAREQRMNTDIRRAIFITIMSATDCQDAYMRLLKLRLKKVQELEIPKVLIHCSAAEGSYNPYYALIAKKLCGDKKLRMAFQFSLWGLFKRMGETDDEEDISFDASETEGNDVLDTRRIVNLAKMYGTLIADGGLTLSVLKSLNLTYLQPKTQMFLEVLFITMILQSQRQVASKRDDRVIVSLVERVRDMPILIGGLLYFVRKVVARTDIAGGNEERATVRWACRVVKKALESFVAEV
ncbi:MAG: suppressor of glycerol defect [Claussenomyces sp. TS43310]|nr:MAG: suppressor of glycerol defect [Claussenomyces sp. TS43310]